MKVLEDFVEIHGKHNERQVSPTGRRAVHLSSRGPGTPGGADGLFPEDPSQRPPRDRRSQLSPCSAGPAGSLPWVLPAVPGSLQTSRVMGGF